MAGRTRRHPRAAPAAALLLAVAGCAAPTVDDQGQRSAERAVSELLERRADAVLDGNAAHWLATVDPRDKKARARQRTVFANLDALPLRGWSYRLLSLRRDGGTATARAELSYRLSGFDSAPVTVARALSLDLRAEHWYVTGERPEPKGAPLLWEQGAVDVVRGDSSIVLGVGQSPALLREFADLADDAVPAVRRAWPGSWPGRLVVLVPGSLEAMAALLGESADDYRGIAAVTTGELGAARHVPADRITVNPVAFAELGAFGKQFVLTHEATHVATRSATSTATPLWLSEGFADWTGYRGTGRTPTQVAPELTQEVREGRVPTELPDDDAFAFATDPARLSRAYESGWLACRMIAEQWGENRLRAFYRAVGGQGDRAGAVDTALREVLGVDTARFTARWRDYVREQVD